MTSSADPEPVDLTRYTSDAEVADELRAYAAGAFGPPDPGALGAWPLPREPHVQAWSRYAARSAEVGAVAALSEAFVQLRFPIEAGVSAREDYRLATRRGVWPDGPVAGGAVGLSGRPITLTIHSALSGDVPIIVVDHRPDFVKLVQALVYRNEPKHIPDSMGACAVRGFNNWERIHRLKAEWEAAPAVDFLQGDWSDHFRKQVMPQKALYRDTFILLSRGPYSDVTAAELGLDEAAWLSHSLSIRIGHECAHLFTLRVLGSMRNHLHDELIADYRGIVSAAGTYRPDWALHFLGLENFPRYRSGGRLENYRGDPPLSDPALHAVGGMVRDAIQSIHRFHQRHADQLQTPLSQARATLALCGLGLLELSHPDACLRISSAFMAASWPPAPDRLR